MSDIKIYSDSTRLIYIEPNDVFDSSLSKENIGKLNGVSITPKYEDLCISFNLIIDQFSRTREVKKSGITDKKDKKVSIEWTSPVSKNVNFSVLSGDEGNGESPNFLTTYYTDISFDSYKKKTQIEGLGVESVDISYESWYTPTVVIKFVDVRGSAIFGREEANHRGDEMTVDNIFGAFFTMPYPRFRLQVKGFYGKPVTYQLACESFKGQLNAQTGNFEAVVRFIAYSWSLMTEIPFMYLVAASNADYEGADYWERHRGDKTWQLIDKNGQTRNPLKLDDMFDKIRNATSMVDDKVSKFTQEQSEKTSDVTKEIDSLKALAEFQNDFINKLNVLFNNKYTRSDVKNYEFSIVFYSDNDEVTVTDEVKQSFGKLYDTLEKCASDLNQSGVTIKNTPNGWTKDDFPTENFKLDNKLSSSDAADVSEALDNSNSSTDETLINTIANDASKEVNKETDTPKGKYGFCIKFFDFSTKHNELNSSYSKTMKDWYDELNAGIQGDIIELIGFWP